MEAAVGIGLRPPRIGDGPLCPLWTECDRPVPPVTFERADASRACRTSTLQAGMPCDTARSSSTPMIVELRALR